MNGFILAAAPFVIIGVCCAIIAVGFRKREKDGVKTYLTEGMCIGMCLGVALSTATKLNMGLGISLGLLIGETVGVLIKKEQE